MPVLDQGVCAEWDIWRCTLLLQQQEWKLFKGNSASPSILLCFNYSCWVWATQRQKYLSDLCSPCPEQSITNAYTPELATSKEQKEKAGHRSIRKKSIRHVLFWNLNIFCLGPKTDLPLKGNFTKKTENDILVTLLFFVLSKFYLGFQGPSDFHSSKFLFFTDF